MTCAEVEELIELFVIGALTDAEAREVAVHLDGCPRCRELERSAREVAQVLALGVAQVDPPPALRSRIMDNAGERPRVTPRVTVVAAPGPTAPRRGLLGWLTPARAVPLAAAVALIPLALSAWLGLQVMQLRSEVRSTETALERSWETSQSAAEILVKAMERGGAKTPLQGTEAAPGAWGTLYYAPAEQEGVLLVSGLPELSRGRVYQCWLMKGEERVNAGTFYRESDGRALLVIKSPMPLDSVDAVAVSEEPHGGSIQPGGQRYMWGRVRRS